LRESGRAETDRRRQIVIPTRGDVGALTGVIQA